MTCSGRCSGSASTGWKRPSVSSAEPARRLGQAQQALRGHDHQRALLGDPRLAAEQVEVLGRRRRVGDADVALGGELQEALEPRRGVLGARALVAVRQQQRQPRGLAPLGQARDDELVDDHLGAVDEVAELRLPQHERLGRLLRVAVLEADAAPSPTAGCCAAPSARARPGRCWIGAVLLAGLGVVQDEVALAEGAALGVLAGEPDRDSLGQQRGERERLGVRPLDPARRASNASRRCSSCWTSFGWIVNPSGTASSSSLSTRRRSADDRGLDLGRGRAIELVLAGRVLDAPWRPRSCSLSRVWASVSTAHTWSVISVDSCSVTTPCSISCRANSSRDRRVLLDHLVHRGLRVGGLVGLVVAEAAVADQVDQHVVAELLAEREREPQRRRCRRRRRRR